MTLSDMQSRSPNRSAFLRLAQKYGLAQVPRNWQEAMTMLQPILDDSQLELVRYLFMPPEQFIQEDNIFPPGAPTAPVVQPIAEAAPAKDTAAAAVTPAAPAAPAAPAPAAPAQPAPVQAAPPTQAAPTTPAIQKVDLPAAPGDAVAPTQRVRFVWTDPVTGAKTNIY